MFRDGDIEQPLLSIIVPVFNTAPFLDECIAGAVAQTYPNKEIVLIDDGSTDGSGTICDDFAARYPHLFRVVHQSHAGVSSARNAGLDVARGDYITFLDADDKYPFAEMLNYYMSILSNNPEIQLLVYPAMSSQHNVIIDFDRDGLETDNLQIQRSYSAIPYNLGVWNKVFKREVIRSHHFPEGRICEDIFFMLDGLIQNLNCVYFCNRYHYFYRYRQGSITTRDLSCNEVLDFLEAYRLMIRHQLEVSPDGSDASDQAYRIVTMLMANYRITADYVNPYMQEFRKIITRQTWCNEYKKSHLKAISTFLYLYLSKHLACSLFKQRQNLMFLARKQGPNSSTPPPRKTLIIND